MFDFYLFILSFVLLTCRLDWIPHSFYPYVYLLYLILKDIIDLGTTCNVPKAKIQLENYNLLNIIHLGNVCNIIYEVRKSAEILDGGKKLKELIACLLIRNENQNKEFNFDYWLLMHYFTKRNEKASGADIKSWIQLMILKKFDFWVRRWYCNSERISP